ncbi:hypothetical protein HPB51_009493 [Rhipicephalus microplus]|uniref:Uncharacterized protein n=1 Tax=Rhipicephalus microplus TaxID=6941 RepID=A0A9J6EGE1_RHIMP|nr:hypothetical protein HPB51_009493 [Rhipicephalus microplus]
MPQYRQIHCFTTGCQTGYVFVKGKPKLSLFSVLKDQNRRRKGCATSLRQQCSTPLEVLEKSTASLARSVKAYGKAEDDVTEHGGRNATQRARTKASSAGALAGDCARKTTTKQGANIGDAVRGNGAAARPQHQGHPDLNARSYMAKKTDFEFTAQQPKGTAVSGRKKPAAITNLRKNKAVLNTTFKETSSMSTKTPASPCPPTQQCDPEEDLTPVLCRVHAALVQPAEILTTTRAPLTWLHAPLPSAPCSAYVDESLSFNLGQHPDSSIEKNTSGVSVERVYGCFLCPSD